MPFSINSFYDLRNVLVLYLKARFWVLFFCPFTCFSFRHIIIIFLLIFIQMICNYLFQSTFISHILHCRVVKPSRFSLLYKAFLDSMPPVLYIMTITSVIILESSYGSNFTSEEHFSVEHGSLISSSPKHNSVVYLKAPFWVLVFSPFTCLLLGT